MQLILTLNNESEYGQLKAVLLHRPGDELRRLTINNFEQMLFDALPNIDQTHRSHDIFSKYLQDQGVQVVYVKDLLRTTLNHSEEARRSLIDVIVEHFSFKVNYQHHEILAALRQWLSKRTGDQLTEDVITGVACSEAELGHSTEAQILLTHCQNDYEFVVPPLPNLLFTRDSFSLMEKNVFIWQMAKAARRNEPLIMRTIFQYHPELVESGIQIVEWRNIEEDKRLATIEGGDVAYLGNDVLLIGCSERTNRAGIEALARTGLFQQIITVVLPNHPDYIHLDTVLSSVGKHAFTLYGPLAHSMPVFTVKAYDANNNLLTKPEWISHGSNVRQALRSALNDPQLVFYDATDPKTSVVEQRQCRHNVLALDDHHVVTYAGGDPVKGVVAQLNRNNRCRVDLVPIEGLLEGGGGTHCMSNALRRLSASE